jgi:hypothetical protein
VQAAAAAADIFGPQTVSLLPCACSALPNCRDRDKGSAKAARQRGRAGRERAARRGFHRCMADTGADLAGRIRRWAAMTLQLRNGAAPPLPGLLFLFGSRRPSHRPPHAQPACGSPSAVETIIFLRGGRRTVAREQLNGDRRAIRRHNPGAKGPRNRAAMSCLAGAWFAAVRYMRLVRLGDARRGRRPVSCHGSTVRCICTYHGWLAEGIFDEID